MDLMKLDIQFFATSGSKKVNVDSGGYIYLLFSWSAGTQNVANNYTPVSWTLKLVSTGHGANISSSASKDYSVTVDGKTWSGTNTIGLSAGATKTLASGSKNIYHNSDGSKSFSFSFSQEIAITFSGSWIGTKSGSGTGTLNKIARASVLGAISNFTLGNAINIPITKYLSSFTDTLTISVAGTTIKTVSGITNGYDVSFTASELTKIYSLLPSATSGSFTFKLTTKSGSTTIGTSSKTATGTIPASVKPSISSVTVSENNTEIVPSDWGVYVKNKSKLKFVVSGSAGSGSSISSVKTTINGSTYTGTTITTNTINVSGSLTATITITDKRNRTVSTTKTITVEDYDDPYINNLIAVRCDKDGNEIETGTYAKVSLNGGVYSLGGKNTPSYVVQYKKTTNNEYQSYTFDVTDSTIDSYVILSGIDGNSSYNFKGVISDYFTSVGQSTQPLLSVFRTVNYLAGGHGMGIGKVAEEEDLLDVAFTTRLAGGIKPVFLEAETDLNNVRTPNFYTGENVANFNYGNCPLDSGTFSLEVVSCGESGQVKQKITYCHKTEAVVWERIYYGDTWGDWIRTSDFASGKLLWGGDRSSGYTMNADQTATLTEAISKQQNGIILIFSYYNGVDDTNYNWQCFFVPKYLVGVTTSGHLFSLVRNKFAYVGAKYLYIRDTYITGHDDNSLTGTTNGITYANNKFVLRYVIGV